MQESWGDLAKQLWWEMTPQTNYHGTPYSFDKFDDSKFLTGEGAMAHGAGHYSADKIDTANKYSFQHGPRKLINIQFKSGIDVPFPDYYNVPNLAGNCEGNVNPFSIPNNNTTSRMSKDWAIEFINENINKKNINNIKGSPERYFPYVRDIIDNPNNYKFIYNDNMNNVYKVNVPNKNFMLNMDKSLNDQSNYIKSAIKKFYDSKDIPNSTKDIYKYLDMDDEYDTKNLYKWLAQDMVNHSYIDPYNNNVGEIEASKMLNKYGIKGIRANGRRDGGINVTFTGKDIKMANTPWQRFINRIPIQTLGKMAIKLYNTPGVKQAVKFADKVATPLMILEGIGLNQPVGQGSDQPPIYPVNGMLKGYITNRY